MKKLIITITIIGIFFILRPYFTDEVDIRDIKIVKIKYYDNDEVILTPEDTKTLKKILKGKKLYYDSPSCGFYKDYRIIFDNGEEIIPAFDSCDILKDKKSGKYFSMGNDRKKLIQLMNKYGAKIRE